MIVLNMHKEFLVGIMVNCSSAILIIVELG